MLDSVRTRLTLWYVAVLALVLLAFSFGVYLLLARSLHHRLDAGLEAASVSVATMLERDNVGGVGVALDERTEPLGVVGELPFVSGDPGEAVEQTADDLDRFAVRVRATGRDARLTGAQAEESAGTLAVVLGLAVALTPTLPVAFLYLLLRPLIARQLRRA